jgi:hypothetical protein
MIARTCAAAAASVTLALASASCVSFYHVPVETPILAKIDTTPFQRVLVVGFVSGGANDIDANSETARLLRSQLRTRGDMRVIDADVLPLVEVIDRRNGVAPVNRAELDPDTPLKIQTEADLEPYATIFDDVEYWKRIGQEYQAPLIVTGSVLFRNLSESGIRSRPVEYVDEAGRVTVQEERGFVDMKGFSLTPTFVFIDGRTGEQLYSESFHEEALYQSSQNTPALSSYFELMDKLLPGFLNTLNTQRIRGTRVLIK